MSRSRLSPDPTHNWKRQGGGWWECVNPGGCGARQWAPDGEPDVSYACDGLQKTELEDGSGPRPVTDGGRKGREDPETGVKHTYGPFWVWVSAAPCCVCGTLDGAPADHWIPVGRGGKDPANCIPVCTNHNDRHELGEETWPETYYVDAKAVAWEQWERFRERKPKLAEKLEPYLPERRAA